MKSLQLKVLSVVASALAVVGVAVAPQATAAERNLVAFGDSVLADPDAGSYFAHRFDPSKGVGVDCPTSNNYAKRAGAKLRLPVRDFSCSGAVSMSKGPQVSQQVDAAIRTGALSPATNRVVITTGFNDTYNHRDMSLPQIRKQFADRTARRSSALSARPRTPASRSLATPPSVLARTTASSTSARARPIPPSCRQSRTLRIRPSGCRWTWRRAPACSSWI